MTITLFKKLESAGKLRKQEVGISQVEGLIRQAMLDLNEAQKIHKIA
ncbi:MAG: hypothetical protein M0Q46_03240 [Endomicrobiales bacterium]|nr:hypothetical protein [Endomicrobiales bacterium]